MINPRRACVKGLQQSFHGVCVCVCVCVSVCLSVTTLAATVFVHGCKVRHHRLLYDDFLDFDSWISLKGLRSGDMAVLVCLYNRGRVLSIE